MVGEYIIRYLGNSWHGSQEVAQGLCKLKHGNFVPFSFHATISPVFPVIPDEDQCQRTPKNHLLRRSNDPLMTEWLDDTCNTFDPFTSSFQPLPGHPFGHRAIFVGDPLTSVLLRTYYARCILHNCDWAPMPFTQPPKPYEVRVTFVEFFVGFIRWFFEKWMTGWWFQIFFIFIPIWGRLPFWLIFLGWVETTS